jgi:hypothetical protein
MKKAAITLSISVVLLVLATAICLPGICGCVSWIGIPDSPISGMLATFFYVTGVPGLVISTCWLAFLAIRSAVRHIRNA